MRSTFPFHHFFKITFRLFDMLCIQCIMLFFLFELHSSTGSFTAHQPIEHSSLSPDSKASSVASTPCCSLWRRSLVCFISIPWQQKGPTTLDELTGGSSRCRDWRQNISINHSSNSHKSLGFCDQFGILPNPG